MENLMSCLLFFALFMLWLYYERKEKRQKAHEEWLYCCQKRLHKIALKFRNDCMEAAEQVIAQYTNVLTRKSYRYGPNSFAREYRDSITRLEEEYKVNYAEKYSSGDNKLRCEVEDLPNYILDEYRAEVSEIANTFRELGYCISNQISKLKE